MNTIVSLYEHQCNYRYPMMTTESAQAEHFAKWLARQLRERGWTQSDFARRIGKNKGVVGNWHRGQRLPSPDSCDVIADVLVLDLDVVLAEAGYRPAIHAVPPDSREARASHLVTRIDWDTQAAGFTLTMLEQLAQEVPKRGVKADYGDHNS